MLAVTYFITKGYYIAAACNKIGIETPDSMPHNLDMLIQKQQQSSSEQRQYAYSIAQAVVEKCSIIEGSILLTRWLRQVI